MSNSYPFVLESLPYSDEALEPVIDRLTVDIHHGKHHQTYVNNLNKLLADRGEMQNLSLEELMNSDDEKIKNNAGGVWNHNFYWQEMKGGSNNEMPAVLREKIERKFGSVEEFKALFKEAALGRFGSGWAWLVEREEGSLEVLSTANQDNPLSLGKKPLLGIDVWEHAYYLKYQNRRAEYVDEWWKIINWEWVAIR